MFSLCVNDNKVLLSTDTTDGIEVEFLLEEVEMDKFFNGRHLLVNAKRGVVNPHAYTFTYNKADIGKFNLHTEDALISNYGIPVVVALDWLKNTKNVKLNFEHTIHDRLREPVKQYFDIGVYTSKINDMTFALRGCITTDVPLYPLGIVIASFRHWDFDTLWEGHRFYFHEDRDGVERETIPLTDPNKHDVTKKPIYFGSAYYNTDEGTIQEVLYGYFEPLWLDGLYLTNKDSVGDFAVARRRYIYKNGKLVK